MSIETFPVRKTFDVQTMIITSQIAWPEHDTYWFLPALSDYKLLKLATRFNTWHVKYMAAAYELGIETGGYINCPTHDGVQLAINNWWTDVNPLEGAPPPQFDPEIIDPISAVTWYRAFDFGGRLPLTTPLESCTAFEVLCVKLQAYAVWTCLLVGCNTLFIELKRNSTRGRPKKGG